MTNEAGTPVVPAEERIAIAAITRDIAAVLSALPVGGRAPRADADTLVRGVMRALRIALRLTIGLIPAADDTGDESAEGVISQALAEAAMTAGPREIAEAVAVVGEVMWGSGAQTSRPQLVALETALVLHVTEPTVTNRTAPPQFVGPFEDEQPQADGLEAVSQDEGAGGGAAVIAATPPSNNAPDVERDPASIDWLRTQHDTIRKIATAQNRVAGALLRSQCTFESIDQQRVEIAFTSQLLVDKATSDSAALEAITLATGNVLGFEVEVVPVVSRDRPRPAPATPDAEAPADEAAGDESLVDAALRLGASLLVDE